MRSYASSGSCPRSAPAHTPYPTQREILLEYNKQVRESCEALDQAVAKVGQQETLSRQPFIKWLAGPSHHSQDPSQRCAATYISVLVTCACVCVCMLCVLCGSVCDTYACVCLWPQDTRDAKTQCSQSMSRLEAKLAEKHQAIEAVHSKYTQVRHAPTPASIRACCGPATCPCRHRT